MRWVAFRQNAEQRDTAQAGVLPIDWATYVQQVPGTAQSPVLSDLIERVTAIGTGRRLAYQLTGTADIDTKRGFGGVMQTFDNTRPIVAGMAVGVARAALEDTRTPELAPVQQHLGEAQEIGHGRHEAHGTLEAVRSWSRCFRNLRGPNGQASILR